MKKIFLVNLLFILFFCVQETYPQKDTTIKESHNMLKEKTALEFLGGIHFGDSRFSTAPFGLVGIGFYFSEGTAIYFEYAPIYIKVENYNYPPYIFKGKELLPGDFALIHEWYLTFQFKPIENFWLKLGFAPESIFSLMGGFGYLFNLDNNFHLSIEYRGFIVGSPIYNFKNTAFETNSLSIGLLYIF